MRAMNRRHISRNARHGGNRHAGNARHARRGFTLVEILVAMFIGLFLMGALMTIVQTNRRVFGEQNQLAQVQDNQRIAMTMMGDVIQAAGYFPRPWANTLTTTLTAVAPFGIGTSIYGTYSAAAPGDTIQVRYMTTGGDQIYNCSGGSNTNAPGVNVMYVNAFQILNGQLVCTMNGTPYTLVGGVAGTGLDITNMSILYGVKANPVTVGNNVDTYMNAAQVNAAALWGNVISVQITLTFTNPLAATPGQPATLQFQRVVGVMSQTGPTI